ncbi:hypothetical protein [Nostoc sp. FACHB-280]|uniref:hypothetical protein n=1 Tax=Nostoc sp. FACHB-280 TaxID=2692839 RepID=UPI00168B84E3|nr:hypothetical protein [Nostoc sp. FACHB-280]MBD2494539.1 hypothetical protein [Nostoc sp. FACHB-280]
MLVHVGGLCLCSSEFYSPNTFQTSSKTFLGMMSGFMELLRRSLFTLALLLHQIY